MRKEHGRTLVFLVMGILLVSCVTAQIRPTPEGFQPILPEFCEMDLYIGYKDVYKASREYGPAVWVYLEKDLRSEFRWVFEKEMPEEERKILTVQAEQIMDFYEYTCKNARRLDMMTFAQYQQEVCGGGKQD
jgi:hypothetical protein